MVWVGSGIEMDEKGACRRLLRRRRGPLRPAGWRWVSGIYDVWHWSQYCDRALPQNLGLVPCLCRGFGEAGGP